jgi:hypothetical protein
MSAVAAMMESQVHHRGEAIAPQGEPRGQKLRVTLSDTLRGRA